MIRVDQKYLLSTIKKFKKIKEGIKVFYLVGFPLLCLEDEVDQVSDHLLIIQLYNI